MNDKPHLVACEVVPQPSLFRFRTVTLVIGIFAALLLTFIADPETIVLFNIPFGASTLLVVKSMAYFALAVGVIHWGFRGMFDYIDRSKLIEKAIEGGNAGQIFIGLALFVLAFARVFSALIGLN